MSKRKKYRKRTYLSVYGKNDPCAMMAELMAIQRKSKKDVNHHDRWWATSESPMIFITSRIFVSFSSTTVFTRRATGYNVLMVSARPSNVPTDA
jgi:hypothetical protein